MEGVLIKFLHHLDLNKDGKPDWDELNALADQYGPTAKAALPLVIQFAEHEGFAAVIRVLEKELKPEALAALKGLEALAATKP